MRSSLRPEASGSYSLPRLRRSTARWRRGSRAHRDSRPADWNTLEEPVELVEALGPVLRSYDTVLLDCLTLWVSNALLRERDAESARRVIISRANKLLELILDSDCSWIVVSQRGRARPRAGDGAWPRIRRRAWPRQPSRGRRCRRVVLHGGGAANQVEGSDRIAGLPSVMAYTTWWWLSALVKESSHQRRRA